MPAVDKIANGIASFTKSKPLVNLSKKFIKDPESALALTTVGSIVLKDGIGCAMYVTQSLNNKKIPDEKRKFVAALDLTNGVLMIAAQIAMFFAMKKYSGPIFDKLFKKSFNEVSKSNIVSRLRMKTAKAGGEVLKKLDIGKSYEEVRKGAYDLFKFVADIAAATIVGKRVIVPLIATPLAAKVKVKMEEYSNKKHGVKPAFEGGEAKPAAAPAATTEVKKPEADGKKLDVMSVQDDDTNLLNRYKKYYGPIRLDK